MSLSSDLHRHLAAWRAVTGLSQQQVADILGHNKSTIQRWETGKRAVDLADLERLAGIYKVDPIALLLAPGDAELVERLTRAKQILQAIPPAAGRRWLETGEDIAGEKLPDRQHAA